MECEVHRWTCRANATKVSLGNLEVVGEIVRAILALVPGTNPQARAPWVFIYLEEYVINRAVEFVLLSLSEAIFQ